MLPLRFSSVVRPLALAALVALGACSSDKKDDPTPTTPTNGFTWTTDGTNYASTTVVKSVAGGAMALLGQYKAPNNDTYNVTINVPATAGTYAVGANGTTGTLASYATTIGSTTTSYVASGSYGSGSVVVTSVTATEIVGTFTFTGEAFAPAGATKALTNGKFNIKR
ncbi:hypothetical protein Q5H93_12825 [Hymenobacter sp. ASUV-10]|uniref:Lipoprotein n=1 Tax=Hymenobacter aranciens TaxID=3063996 RepID=A0ABT9BCX3_9BACT|nr:hypothetical protein [Hymenobacter sp. ASUV-10]MDO7875620.1 hypothetical protein [Hymenobacter sp. ASUV-10]